MMRRAVAPIYQSICISIVTAIAITIAVPCHASSITWSAAQNISGDADVSTAGTLVGAFNVGGSGLGSTTVNGVTFNPFVLSGSSATSGNFAFAIATSFAANNTVGSALAPFSSLSASYQTLLSSAAGDFTTPFTLTMSGLTVGHSYAFEWWSNFSNSDGLSTLTTATAGGSGVTLNTNTNTGGTGLGGGLGQFATGTFTADAATQVVTFSSANQDAIDGFQLRSVESPSAVPEPASLILFGSAALGLALHQRWRARRNRTRTT
jgi:hypothetical protein